METAVCHRLPPSVRQPTRLNIFNLRNRPTKLSLAETKAEVARAGVLDKKQPHEFVEKLIDLEHGVGTYQAVLVGLLSVSDNVRMAEINEGLELFEKIRQALPPRLAWISDYDRLYDLLGPALKYVEGQRETLLGLKSLADNLSLGTDKGVGDCLVCSSLYALATLSRGGLAGEARRIGWRHNYTLLPIRGQGFYLYDRQATSPDFFLLEEPHEFVLSNHFSFISSLLLGQTSEQVENKYKLVASDREKLLLNLELVELINPFHSYIYKYRKDIYFIERKPELEEMNKQYYLQMREQKGSPLTFS